jgi:hypothetical protein
MSKLSAVLLIAVILTVPTLANPQSIGSIQDFTKESAVVFQSLPNGHTLEIITFVPKTGDKELIRLTDSKGRLLLAVHMDGSTSVGQGFQSEDAAADFWKAVGQFYPKYCNDPASKDGER